MNRNAVPFDPRPPMVTSGHRIGTPALATRGFGDTEFTEVADIIALALRPGADNPRPAGSRRPLTAAFPLYYPRPHALGRRGRPVRAPLLHLTPPPPSSTRTLHVREAFAVQFSRTRRRKRKETP